MQTPVINMNGTSGRELLDQVQNAMEAVRKAKESLFAMTPHGRDYQTAADGVYQQARLEHADRIRHIEAVENDLLYIGLDICRQQEGRSR